MHHKVRHLQQSLVTPRVAVYIEVASRVHLHESSKEAPLEQTFPEQKLNCLGRIIGHNSSASKD